jgi:DinB superfamily
VRHSCGAAGRAGKGGELVAESEAGGSAMRLRGPPPPPPPPIVPVPSVEVARVSAAEATGGFEATMLRATSFSDEERHRSVNNEWSTVDSLRHVVLIIDLWLSKAILSAQDPFHPIALPPTFMPPKLPGSSIDPDARPTFDEVCDVLRGRLATVRTYIDALTPDELEHAVEAHAKTVGGALCVLFGEMTAHNRFINRDLDIIEGSRSSQGGP